MLLLSLICNFLLCCAVFYLSRVLANLSNPPTVPTTAVKAEVEVKIYDHNNTVTKVINAIVGGGEKVATLVKATGRVHIRVKRFLDGKGNEAPAENLRWRGSDDALITAAADEDGKGAWYTPVGPTTPLVQAILEADPVVGEGEGLLTGLVDLEIIAGDAVTVELEVDIVE